MDYQEALKIAKECENVASPMPQYQCHKKVWALRIKQIIRAPLPTIEELQKILDEDPQAESAGGFIVPEDRFAPIAVSTKFLEQHKPEAGGYLVFYEDGYRSFSPGESVRGRIHSNLMKITLEIESSVPLDVIVANFPKRLFVTDTSQPKIRPTGGSSSSHPMGVVAVLKTTAAGCSYNHETLRSKSDLSKCPECGEDVGAVTK